MDSKESVLGYGIRLIILNIGMYFAAPAIIIYKIKK
jgi:peptidyl-prolyl cis-trans isomerase B (cyclophilin B)